MLPKPLVTGLILEFERTESTTEIWRLSDYVALAAATAIFRKSIEKHQLEVM